MPNTEQAGRYRAPRKCIDWGRSDGLEMVKMLAWVVKKEERVGSAELWERVGQLLPGVARHLRFRAAITLPVLCAQTLEFQGAVLTPGKLYQRADKAERYGEFNSYQGAVRSAYLQLTRPKKDPKAV